MPQGDHLTPFRRLTVTRLGPACWHVASPENGWVSLAADGGAGGALRAGFTLRLRLETDPGGTQATADLFDAAAVRAVGLFFGEVPRFSEDYGVHRAHDMLPLGYLAVDRADGRIALRARRLEAGMLARPGTRMPATRRKRFTLDDIAGLPDWIVAGGVHGDPGLAPMILSSTLSARARIGRVLHRARGHVLIGDLLGTRVELRADAAGRALDHTALKLWAESPKGGRTWTSMVRGRIADDRGPLADCLRRAAGFLAEGSAMSGHDRLSWAAHLDAHAEAIAERLAEFRRRRRAGSTEPGAAEAIPA